MLEESFIPAYSVHAFPPTSPYADKADEFILREYQFGINLFNSGTEYYARSTNRKHGDQTVLMIDHLAYTFYLLLIGNVLSIVVFAFECFTLAPFGRFGVAPPGGFRAKHRVRFGAALGEGMF